MGEKSFLESLDESGDRVFQVHDKVRFRDDYLINTPDQSKRYAGRIGVVSGFRAGACDPIVIFPKVGRKREEKLFEVFSAYLEKVVS